MVSVRRSLNFNAQSEHQNVPIQYITSSFPVPIWYLSHTYLTPILYLSDTGTILIWYRYNTYVVPIQYLSGTYWVLILYLSDQAEIFADQPNLQVVFIVLASFSRTDVC